MYMMYLHDKARRSYGNRAASQSCSSYYMLRAGSSFASVYYYTYSAICSDKVPRLQHTLIYISTLAAKEPFVAIELSCTEPPEAKQTLLLRYAALNFRASQRHKCYNEL